MRESEVEKYFRWAVETQGGRTWKTKAVGEDGFPDRVAIMPDGSTWLVELKAPRGRLSEAQKDFAAACKVRNVRYACLWSKDMVSAWIQKYFG